jgi:S-adenosylmethionine hydrolase
MNQLRPVLYVVGLLLFLGCAQAPVREPSAVVSDPPPLLFMTDFGVTDDSVVICKGAMLSIEPRLRILDITHEVSPFSILDGARYLAGTTGYYPPGTVFVSVVDPGVGSERKAIVAKSKRGQYFVLPDNGLITLVENQDGIEAVRQITNSQWMIRAAISSTFHGRDIFSPVGAHLAHGEDWTQVGPSLTQWVRLSVPVAQGGEGRVSGEVIGIEAPYGNLVTNIRADWLEKIGVKLGDTVRVHVGKRDLHVRFVHTFSDVALRQTLLYIDSRDRVALALNQGNFAAHYKVKAFEPLLVEKKR